MSGFKKAERKQVKLKLGIAGPSGSGKTFSALRIVKGMMEAAGTGGRIALIDSENRSASLYADMKGMPDFDVLELTPPYTVDKYIDAIELALKERYDFLIVDSASHVWSGEGGLLQEKDLMDSRPGGNSYTNWAKMTPKWNRFVSGILHSDVHMICTMRSKQDYVLETNEKGKQAPKKVGMAPQVRDGFEYELTAVFDMGMDHNAIATKDRTNLFNERTWRPDEKTGKEIYAWLNSGKVPDPVAPPQEISGAKIVTLADARLKEITALADPVKWPKGSVSEFCMIAYGIPEFWKLDDGSYRDLLQAIQMMTASQAKAEARARQVAEHERKTAAEKKPDAFAGGLASEPKPDWMEGSQGDVP